MTGITFNIEGDYLTFEEETGKGNKNVFKIMFDQKSRIFGISTATGNNASLYHRIE